nr:ribonuclease H-like domain, reverse transcriptase, RNA-dependent DNA polymerase [Tanacetum cinerariifolium]
RIKAIRLFLAYASFMRFMVYRMDIKSAFLYERIEEEVYVCQPLGFEDLDHPDKDKYVVEILRKFKFLDVKSASTPVDIEKTLVKDADGDDVDVHLYISMIRSLMYLTVSRPDIMYADKQSSMVRIGKMIQYNLTAGLTMPTVKGFPCDKYLSCIDMNLELNWSVSMRVFGTPRIRVFLEYSCTGLRTMPTVKRDISLSLFLNTLWEVLRLSLGRNRLLLSEQLIMENNKGFSVEHIPLFVSMLAIQVEEGEGSGHPSEPQPPPSTSQPTNEEPIPNTAQDLVITRLKLRVKKLENKKKKARTPQPMKKRLFKVRVKSFDEENLDEGIFDDETNFDAGFYKVQVTPIQTKRTKLQQEQDRLGHEAAVRLQEELDEEERQRMARVHEATQSFTEEEWENIRARKLEVLRELRK